MTSPPLLIDHWDIMEVETDNASYKPNTGDVLGLSWADDESGDVIVEFHPTERRGPGDADCFFLHARIRVIPKASIVSIDAVSREPIAPNCCCAHGHTHRSMAQRRASQG